MERALAIGARVELHSLSRVDLNGRRGVLHSLLVESGRWSVVLDGSFRGGGVRVKASNLKRLPDRADAARVLCILFGERHPEKGFLIHPAIGFEESAGEVSVRATAPMTRGEILLVVPESAMVAVSSAACRELALGGGQRMGGLLDAVDAAFAEQFEEGLPVLEAHNVMLAVLVMHVACAPACELHTRFADTWPPIDATRGLPVCWDDAQLRLLEGTALLEAVKALQSDAHLAFSKVVAPLLSAEATLAACFMPPGGTLRDAFLHGLSLALSRSHADNKMRSSSTTKGKLAPLADLFNGVPEGHPDVNVELHRGKWPFLRGGRCACPSADARRPCRCTRHAPRATSPAAIAGASPRAPPHWLPLAQCAYAADRNDCDLHCTAVALTRDVAVGDELIYSCARARTPMAPAECRIPVHLTLSLAAAALIAIRRPSLALPRGYCAASREQGLGAECSGAKEGTRGCVRWL
jgi:hypothetical protein